MSYSTPLSTEVTLLHEVMTLAGGVRASGEAANITTTLLDPDGQSSAVAVAVTEVGATGLYHLKVTPDEAGIWLLTVTNPAGTDEAVSSYKITASASAAATSLATDSYCSLADVVAVVQYLAAFTGSTTPTEDETLNFMARRAATLYFDVRVVLGSTTPGPDNYSVAFTGSTDQDVALERVLIHYNAIGAAVDVLSAAGAGEIPARSERMAELYAMWNDRGDELRLAALMYMPAATRTKTHISIGEISQASTTTREEDGLTFDGTTTW